MSLGLSYRLLQNYTKRMESRCLWDSVIACSRIKLKGGSRGVPGTQLSRGPELYLKDGVDVSL